MEGICRLFGVIPYMKMLVGINQATDIEKEKWVKQCCVI